MRTCGTCGREAPEDFSFCPACGTPLSSDAGAGDRRRVTILFTDIVGSTELGERLDPERLQGVLARYYEAMRAVIERHGGTVEKFIGDAVMAVFGVPRIREDDALRAVRAAAEMGEALDGLNEELRTAHGVDIHVRTGVNTGEVVVADLAQGTLAAGDAVNVAARLEQAAGPDEILIGEGTYRLVRDAVLAEPLDPLGVKGKVDRLTVFRLQKVDPRAAGFARRLDAPMVGRRRELSSLLGAFDRTVSDRSCHLFTVLGVGGVGKSRLLEAFVAELDDRATVLRGRCLPYGDGITFLPVVEAVRQAAGLSAVETPEEAREMIGELVAGREGADRIVAQVGQIMGIAGEEATQEETLWAIRRLFEGIAADRPLVYLIDDVQWAEPTLLGLVEHIADWSVDAPILLVCMARPELLEQRPDWGGGKLNATSISLEPLSDDECATLVANLLAVDAVAPEIRERVASLAEGHPLFAEEMLAMLVDEGRLTLADGVWTAGDLDDLAVPPTTAALLAARIDRLDAEDRELLMRASVMGQVFYRDALELLADGLDVGEHLASLMRKQFVRPERSDVGTTEALAFRHLLIHDAAYEGLTKSSRADLHERFAGWLVERAPERQELIGYHLERAYRYLEEIGSRPDHARGLAERAAVSLGSAGQGSYGRGDMPATASLLGRAVALMSTDDRDLVVRLSDLASAHAEMGALVDANAAIHRAIQVAERRGDTVAAARAGLMGARISYWGRQTPEEQMESDRRARDSLPLFEEASDAEGAAMAWTLIGDFAWSRCQAAEAGHAWRRATDLFRQAGNRWMAAEELSWLASVAVWGPTPCDEAMRALESMGEEARGSPVAALEISSSIGVVLMMQGALDEARDRILANDLRMRELGRSLPLAHASQQIGFLELLSGRAAEAERILGEGARALDAMGSDAVGIVSAFHAQALYALGRFDEADGAGVKAIRDGGLGISERVMGLGVRAMVAARTGAFEEAERLAREGLTIIDVTDFLCDRADARVALAEVLELAGRTEDAIRVADEALELFHMKGNVTQATDVGVRLDRLHGRG